MSSRFVTVSRDRFFAFVNPRDIVLRTEREEVFWETRNRTVVGRSTPGYAKIRPGGEKTWELTYAAFEESRR